MVRFYNKRGTAERWIKEGKQAVKMTRLSCHRISLQRSAAEAEPDPYNLGNLWRRPALPDELTAGRGRVCSRLAKTRGRLMKHARYYWLPLAESHLTRRLSGSMLHSIAMLPSPAG